MAARDRVGKTVLFLGTDNRDRSRVAEILFDATASRIGLPWKAVSRGLALEAAGKTRGPMNADAVRVLKERGLRTPACERPPAQVTAEDLAGAALVVAMNESEQAPLLSELMAAPTTPVEFWDIAAGPLAIPAIERAVADLVARLLGGRKASEVPEPPAAPAPPAKATTVRIGRETKGRRGKGVTIITDLPLDEPALLELAAKLKGVCGSGGTAKEGRVEIQGDHRDRLTTELEKLGYKVKRVGG